MSSLWLRNFVISAWDISIWICMLILVPAAKLKIVDTCKWPSFLHDSVISNDLSIGLLLIWRQSKLKLSRCQTTKFWFVLSPCKWLTFGLLSADARLRANWNSFVVNDRVLSRVRSIVTIGWFFGRVHVRIALELDHAYAPVLGWSWWTFGF